MGDLSKNNVIMVYFGDDLSDEQCKAVYEKVKKVENVSPEKADNSSTKYISRTEGLDSLLVDLYGEDYTEEEASVFNRLKETGNPLPNGARVQFEDLSKFEQTIKNIKAIDGVASIQSHNELSQKIVNIRTTINHGCVWIIALLLIIAFVIVSNTIRITMYNRKLEISIMKAVGATNRFIRFPFMVEGILLGIISAALTTGLLYTVYYFAADAIRNTLTIQPIPFRDMALTIFGIFVLIGVVLGLLCSAFTITKYLRKEGSEFRAL
jgi:cell division transport system permease protein